MQCICTKCKQSKQLTLKFFPPHNKKKNGFDSWCRECRSVYRSSICRGAHRNSISDKNLIILKQSIKSCMICETTEKLVVDHDHKTNKIRGLLCSRCNLGLGQFKDNQKSLLNAVNYLNTSTSLMLALFE